MSPRARVAQRQYTLDHPLFAGRTGSGVGVAVIDSGIHAGNPHVSGVGAAVHITASGESDDAVDRIGHGTAVAAAILEKAPAIDLFAVRVFDQTLATSAAVLVRAIERAVAHGCRLINLSLGTANPARADAFVVAITRAVERGVLIVSARELHGVAWLPGSLPGVVGVQLDAECPRAALRVGRGALHASGLPRPIPGVPRERNVQGISFAVANATGFLARLLETEPDVRTVTDVHAMLDTL
ncbi:MAG TPA: S8 family serine peptidase [Longimicrobiales bacterium]|nr:S8 family serine peptidase [Longimicrobiales bacterium]